MELRAGKGKCFLHSVFVLKKKGKEMGTDTSLISHVKINGHLHVLLEYEMHLASADLLQHTHTERDSFLMAISHPTTLKSLAELHLQESSFCNIL